jgi:hypothetical protein
VVAGEGLVDPSSILNLVSTVELGGGATTVTALEWTTEALTPGVALSGALSGAVGNATTETLVVPVCALQAGAAYRFNMTVELATGRRDACSLEIIVNRPPRGGSLVAPASIVALNETLFHAPDWTNPDAAHPEWIASNLTYVLSYAPAGAGEFAGAHLAWTCPAPAAPRTKLRLARPGPIAQAGATWPTRASLTWSPRTPRRCSQRRRRRRSRDRCPRGSSTSSCACATWRAALASRGSG